MGIYDRDYDRQERRGGGGFFSQITPMVKWLLILNLGIYFLDLFLVGADGQRPLRSFGAFTIQTGVLGGRIWEFVTFQFLHGGFQHVLFNCMGIFFFGPWMERWWGSQKFIIYYLLCGVAGAAFFTLLVYLGILPRDGLQSPLVGASAGIYGILIGVAVVAPDLRVRLFFPPIELSMRQLAVALMAISAGAILLKWGGNEGGEAGHLGGAILGFLLVRYPWLLRSEAISRVIQEKVLSRNPTVELRSRSMVEKERAAAVDVILDKISRDGFHSLSQAEKDFLQEVAKAKQSP